MTTQPILDNELRALNSEVVNLLERNNLLHQLIRNTLAESKVKDVPVEEELKVIKNNFFKQNKLNNEEEFVEWQRKNNIKEAQLFQSITDSIKLNKYSLENFNHMTESLFLKKKDDLDKVTYSLIRVKDSYLANELYLRIKEGEDDFGKIAKKYSIGPEKSSNGLIGPVSISTGHKSIQDLIRSSEIEDIQKPVKLGNMYILFRLEAFFEAKLDENIKLELSKELFSNSLDEETKLIINSIKVKYKLRNS